MADLRRNPLDSLTDPPGDSASAPGQEILQSLQKVQDKLDEIVFGEPESSQMPKDSYDQAAMQDGQPSVKTKPAEQTENHEQLHPTQSKPLEQLDPRVGYVRIATDRRFRQPYRNYRAPVSTNRLRPGSPVHG